MDTNVKNVKDTNENGYITIYNQAAYVAKCLIGYTVDGVKQNFESPYFPVLQSYKFQIPQHATDITFLAIFTFDFSDWGVIFNKQYNTPPKVCFALYGTLFNPSYEEIKCPLGSTGGGNVGTTPNTPEGMPPIMTPSSCKPCCFNPYCKPCCCEPCCKPCCKPCCCDPCCKSCCKPCCCDPCCKPCCKPCCCDPCCKPCCKPCCCDPCYKPCCKPYCDKCSINDPTNKYDIVYPANYYDNTDSNFSSSNIYYDYYNY